MKPLKNAIPGGLHLLGRRSEESFGLLAVDKTGLTENHEFDFTLNPAGYSGGPCSPDFGPPLARVLEDQFGLALESQKVQETLIVIEGVERLSEN